MDNEYLDLILKDIANKKGVYHENLQEESYAKSNVFKFKDAIQYLTENGYIINNSIGSQSHYHVSPKGQKLLSDGGFVEESKYKKDILEVSRESRDYARKAYYVAIAGIVVAIILFLISKI
jgi:predicted transcriptional regulator